VTACSWSTARELAASAAGPVPSRRIPLAQAAGAVLAQDAVALSDLPQTDTSAMDGWAVAGTPPWRVDGTALAGRVPPPLLPGAAIAIATGAMLPDGADGVLRREHGLLDGAVLTACDPAAAARIAADVRRAGRECVAGDVVLPAGSRLGPVALGLLAAAGHDAIEVRHPTVDLLVLGDELLSAGRARDGRLRDALGPMLTSWLPALGLAIGSRRHVPDRVGALELTLRGCLSDVVVTTGSTARGPVDHLHGLLEALGATLTVDGVQVRPGHPQLLALLPDGRPLVGLPGNPLAAVSGLLTLLEPLAATLAGAPGAPIRTGTVAEAVPAGAEATRLVPIRAGRPVLFAGPAMLRGLALADHVAVVPPGGVGAGDAVQLLPLP
jgi:molybdopterin molybdotransferase